MTAHIAKIAPALNAAGPSVIPGMFGIAAQYSS